MKKTLFILFITLFIGTAIFAQVPQGLKYQAVVRDVGGAILQNTTIGLQISILKGSETGPSVYTETWTVTTNNFGLVNLNIGVGEGSSTDDFSSITWGSDNYWLKVALDKNGGTNYTEMGTSKLLSVPYALYSEAPWVSSGDTISYKPGNVGIGTSHPNAKLEVQSANNDTLFCVKDASGRPVFIVYPDGAQVIVDTSSTKSGASGRFLISGRGISKTEKGTEMNFLDLTKKNYLIGNNAASGLIPSGSEGIKNSILGYEAGYSLTTGYQNTFIGYQAGHNSIGGNSNIFIGNNAGYHSEKSIGSVNIGYYAGYL
ncbi:MAG: hypothetical protein L3J56_09265 [Bacteroidales bacterium]|nr:hypothetical protein [Bacteroidales bacterium]